jgi:hypothetical protein
MHGEEEDRMPPNSTQNLNAKLSSVSAGSRRHGAARLAFSSPPIQSSAPPVRIVGVPGRYRGGYHLSI